MLTLCREADTIVTYEVLKGSTNHYPELDNDMKSLSEFSTRRKPLILLEC
jgi:DNA polymerase-3 subunit epsilon